MMLHTPHRLKLTTRQQPLLALPVPARCRFSYARGQHLKNDRCILAAAVALPEGQTVTLRDETPAPGASAEATTAGPYNWLRNWWPISPVENLDTERPTKHTLLGRDYVVWQQQGQWQVFQDKCPHRLAPLSQGRIIDNSLQCSYHGWTFDPNGQCTNIPQLPASQQQSSCSNKRSCATSYPTMVEQGILYAWLDASPEGVELSKAKGVPLALGAYKPILMDFPCDYTVWLEQQMDPTHAHFLHATSGFFKASDVLPMECYQAPEVDLQKGFEMKHGAYSKKQQGMQATRTFFPPCTHVGLYNLPTGMAMTYFNMSVPVSPGVCRFFFSVGFLGPGTDRTIISDSKQHKGTAGSQAAEQPDRGVTTGTQGTAANLSNTAAASASSATGTGRTSELAAETSSAATTESAGKSQRGVSLLQPLGKAAAAVFGKVPHWVYNGQTFADSDVVMMAAQERVWIRNKLGPKNYHLPAINADIGVLAMNRWLAKAQYPESLFPDAKHPGETEPLGTLPLEQLLDRKTRHVDHCVVCQKGERLVTKICYTTSVAAAMCGAFALALAATGLVETSNITAGGVPFLVSSLLTPVLAWLSVKLWDFREERFVSGLRAWNRNGGLSMVKR